MNHYPCHEQGLLPASPGTHSALPRAFFYGAIKIGKAYSQKKLTNRPISLFLRTKRLIANRLVFSKITDRIGGRVRFCVSAAAPLAKDIAEFFHAVGLVILEGYGLTETSPCNTMNTTENLKFGTVGKPIPRVKIRIAADGEILTQGPNVMKGYYTYMLNTLVSRWKSKQQFTTFILT